MKKALTVLATWHCSVCPRTHEQDLSDPTSFYHPNMVFQSLLPPGSWSYVRGDLVCDDHGITVDSDEDLQGDWVATAPGVAASKTLGLYTRLDEEEGGWILAFTESSAYLLAETGDPRVFRTRKAAIGFATKTAPGRSEGG